MHSFVAYRKAVGSITTHYLALPEPQQGEQAAQELATLPDGRTIVVLFDGYTLPTNQPAEITASIEHLPVPLPDETLAQVKAASPHVRLINERVRGAIAERYSTADEIKLLRTAPSPEMGAYNDYVESCRDWGRAEKAKFGL